MPFGLLPGFIMDNPLSQAVFSTGRRFWVVPAFNIPENKVLAEVNVNGGIESVQSRYRDRDTKCRGIESRLNILVLCCVM